MAGLFGRIPSEGRWLWIGGLAADVSNAQLTERIGTHQAREGSGSTYELHRRDGGAWVHFARPSLAQMCLTALNGTNLTGAQGGASTLRVRYAADREDTSAAPAVLYLKRPLPTAAGIAAEEATAKKAHTSSSNGRPDAPAAKRAKNDESAGRASQQKAQPASAHSASPATVCAGTKSEAGVLKGATASGRAGAAASSADATNGLVTTSAAAGRSDGSANLGANGVDGRSILGAHTKTMGPGALADMLRIALHRLDIDVALAEIVHFLQSDERLPTRTRKAVQFLNGLRQQMVYEHTHSTHPELFDCPLRESAGEAASPTSVSTYTFRQVRQGFGESFHDKFWPVFRAFNCVLPAHAPEEASAADGGVSAAQPSQ